MAPESQSQMVARLLKSGGFILLVGGNLEDQLAPRFKNHAQVIVWDDVRQGTLQKSIPSNTRAIAYSRYISHPMSAKLREAAGKLKCPVFPMLKPREMKELLTEIMPDTPVPTEPTSKIDVEIVVPDTPAILTKGSLKKPGRGQIRAIVAQEVRSDETPSAAARRLLSIAAEKYGIQTTFGSLEQSVRVHRQQLESGKRPPTVAESLKGVKKTPTKKVEDAFTEGERLLNEAKTAIDLFLEFLPKLRAERNATLERHEKLRKMLDE